jgi:hypothetical protein
MDDADKIRLFEQVFAPQTGEKVLFLMDLPHGTIKDYASWKESRDIGEEWYQLFQKMGKNEGFSVNLMKFKSTGMHNTPVSEEVFKAASQSNLVLAFMGYSMSSSLMRICLANGSITRAAGMQLERIMETTAFKANYSEVGLYAHAIKKFLDAAIGAEIIFSTGDRLHIDLRNRKGVADTGDCTKTGQYINFPSGEGFIAPYEGATEEFDEFGASNTNGIWPVRYGDESGKFVVKHNRVVEVIGAGEKVGKMRDFFRAKETRANVAELGIGCNPYAVVTGNVALDEKVGLHIAYGTSTHFGGHIESDVHLDIVYAKDCPIEGTTVTLLNKDGSKIGLIKDAKLRYNILH